MKPKSILAGIAALSLATTPSIAEQKRNFPDAVVASIGDYANPDGIDVRSSTKVTTDSLYPVEGGLSTLDDSTCSVLLKNRNNELKLQITYEVTEKEKAAGSETRLAGGATMLKPEEKKEFTVNCDKEKITLVRVKEVASVIR